MIIHAEHIKGYAFKINSSKHSIISDQSHDFGGDEQGPMPSELFLWAIGSCFGQTMIFVAEKMHRKIQNLKLCIDGKKDNKSFKYDAIHITVNGCESQEFLDNVVKLSKKYCYITNSLSDDIQIKFSVNSVGG